MRARFVCFATRLRGAIKKVLTHPAPIPLALQPRANRPQVRKQRSKQRGAQIRRAGTSASSLLESDGALDHLDVSVAPLLHAFIEINEQLADLPLDRMRAIERDERVLKRNPFLRRLRAIAREQLCGNRVSALGNEACKRVVERGRVIASLDGGALVRSFGIVAEDPRILVAQQTLELAELPTLKPARAREKIAKRQKRNRRHRFQDVDLLHHGLQNREHALERGTRLHLIARDERARQMVALMQLLLEPKFIHLMDDDEQHLVMLGLARRGMHRERALQIKQRLNFEIASVGRIHGDRLADAPRYRPLEPAAPTPDTFETCSRPLRRSQIICCARIGEGCPFIATVTVRPGAAVSVAIPVASE